MIPTIAASAPACPTSTTTTASPTTCFCTRNTLRNTETPESSLATSLVPSRPKANSSSQCQADRCQIYRTLLNCQPVVRQIRIPFGGIPGCILSLMSWQVKSEKKYTVLTVLRARIKTLHFVFYFQHV